MIIFSPLWRFKDLWLSSFLQKNKRTILVTKQFWLHSLYRHKTLRIFSKYLFNNNNSLMFHKKKSHTGLEQYDCLFKSHLLHRLPFKEVSLFQDVSVCVCVCVCVCVRSGRVARAPALLRSDAKVPLRSGLCDMNDIVDDKNQYRRSLYEEYAVCVGHQLPPSQLLKKKTWRTIPAPTTAGASCLRLNADDHNWWTTMPVKRHQQSSAEK